MKWIDETIATFRRDADEILKCKPHVAIVEYAAWLDLLPALYEQEPDGWVKTHHFHAASGQDGWQGLFVATITDGGTVVWGQRSGFDGYGELKSFTTVAAATQEAVNAALADAAARYVTYRRDQSRVHDVRRGSITLRRVDWNDVSMPAEQLDEIRNNVRRFANAKQLYAEMRLPYRRGLLFYGPPGNGKTMLCRAIATEIEWPVIYVSPRGRGETATDVESGFAEASKLAPCILWFDDVDGLLAGDVSLSYFLNALDSISSRDGVLVLATTNRPDKLDPAIVSRPSRFDRIFHITRPVAYARDRFLATRMPQLDATARAELVRRTADMSMSFIQEVVVGSTLRAMDRGAQPTAADAIELLDTLAQHMRDADRRFEESAKSGFGRRVALDHDE